MMNNLILELTDYIQNWGLWKNVTMIEGTMSEAGGAESKANPEAGGAGSGADPEADEKAAPPAPALTILCEGPLNDLLYFSEYRPNREEIGDAAWEVLFNHTDLVREYLEEHYEISSPEEYLHQKIGDILDNPDYSNWDPLEFDSWEDFQAFCGGEEPGLRPQYKRYDSYEDYEAARDGAENLTIDDIIPEFNRLVEEAKAYYKAGGGDPDLNLTEIRWRIVYGFEQILAKHGLSYHFECPGMMVCHQKESEI